MKEISSIDKANVNYIYKNLDMSCLDKYLDNATLKHMKKKEQFYPSPEYIGYIKKGKLERHLVNKISGNEKIIRILGEKNIIGEVSFFLKHRPYDSFTILEDSDIYIFNKDVINNILLKDPVVVQSMLEWLATHVASLSNQLEENMDRNPKYKVCKFLYNYIKDFGYLNKDGLWEFKGNISQKKIGDYIGINRVCVNREVQKLIDDNILERQGDKWIIVDENSLRTSLERCDT